MMRSPGMAGFGSRPVPVSFFPTDQRHCRLSGDRRAVAVPRRHTDRALDQGDHGDADPGVNPGIFRSCESIRDDQHRDRTMMKAPAGLKSPVGLVTVALTAAILLAVSLLIVTGTRGEVRDPAVRIISPATK